MDRLDKKPQPPPAQAQARRLLGITLVLWLAVTTVHYMTDHHAIEFHNVYRRLYYIPIVLAAFAYGWRSGLLSALACSLAYLPHAFFLPHHHRDPAPTIDKLLEIVLYLVVGGLTGWLVERQRQVQRSLERSLDELDALQAQLVRAGKLSALGELSSGLAHELRNPLASIMGSAEALASEFEPTHRKHRIAQLMLREIDRLNRVVSNFLAFARPAPPMIKTIDLLEVVNHVRELTEHQPEGAQLTWRVELKPGQLIVNADPDQIEQVILNLVLNLAQAMRASPTPSVRIYETTRPLGQHTSPALAIEDNGPGISAQDLEHIFDPYFTTRHEGSGLGLSISHRIMESHGGFLDARSKPGETTFWLVFKAQEDTP